MSVILPSIAMFTIGTSLLTTLRLSVMRLARQAEKPSNIITSATRQRTPVAARPTPTR